MKNIINGTKKIGDIVTMLPKAAEIFRMYQIDFCCGGDRLLTQVIQEQGLNETIIIDQLNRAYEEAEALTEKGIDWETTSNGDLIEYIVNKHHTYVKAVLPRLSELTTKILRVHGVDHGDVLTKVHKYFHLLKLELDQHLIKEEEVLFPLINQYDTDPSEALLARIHKVNQELEEEHEGAGDLLKKLRGITDNYTVPQSGCTTYALTFQGLEDLEWDLFQHIHLENNVLFPRLSL